MITMNNEKGSSVVLTNQTNLTSNINNTTNINGKNNSSKHVDHGGEMGDSKAKNNITIMLILTSFLYTVSNTPYLIWYIFINITNNTAWNGVISTIFNVSLFCLILLCLLKIFIYFFFNKIFREEILKHFRKLRFILPTKFGRK